MVTTLKSNHTTDSNAEKNALIDQFVDIESLKNPINQFSKLNSMVPEEILSLDMGKISPVTAAFDQILQWIENFILESNPIIREICFDKISEWYESFEDQIIENRYDYVDFLISRINSSIKEFKSKTNENSG